MLGDFDHRVFDFGGGGPNLDAMQPLHRIRLVGLVIVFVAGTSVVAERPLPEQERLRSSPVLQDLKPNPDRSLIVLPAQNTVAQMFVPEGFKVEIVSSEPNLFQPVAFTFDERGRIWVAEALSYPTKRPEGEGLDRIVIMTDRDGNGSFESRKVFAEGLNLVSGLEVGYGGVWVGAAPELLFIPDGNHDDKPDGPPQQMLDGFGFQDTHETLNSFLWGPDGWLYGIQGVFNTARIGTPETPVEQRPELRAGVWRFHPVRHEFEIFAHGGSNPWGLDYDEHGQLFMTHCRSFWGRGPTTHVIQGGQFWNQVNANYASFIVANPPKEYPEFRNYLLASARYGHGAGGAGPRGSDAIYGGHSHVGAMFYLGDNWPDEYRGNLFTHNLGGHQINQQVNKPLGSGYDTVHAGRDVLFCTDPQYVAVDLKYGPDGSVYFIDWYDEQHCHNPNTEQWDRGNGRIYRMEWSETYRPVTVNLRRQKDVELVNLQDHKNRWFARTARRLLNERSLERKISAPAVADIRGRLSSRESQVQLNALWTRHLTGGLKEIEIRDALADEDPFVRAWAVQLAGDEQKVSGVIQKELVRISFEEPSPVVRRYLASVIQRVPENTAWGIIGSLAKNGEDVDDRNLPYLLWHGMASLWSSPDASEVVTKKRLNTAMKIARETRLPQLADWIYWFAAALEGPNLDRAIASLGELRDEELLKRLTGVWLAMESRANLPMPKSWKRTAGVLGLSSDAEVRRLTQQLAAVYGDNSSFGVLRETLARFSSDPAARAHAFSVLSRAQDEASLDVFLNLLEEDEFRLQTLRLLARFDSARIPPAILAEFNFLRPSERSAAIDALTSRASFAIPLLVAIGNDVIPRGALSAFHVRQLSQLKDADVDQRIAEIWGPIKTTPAQKQVEIERLDKVFSEAPLWAYDQQAGLKHFELLCAPCHRVGEVGVRLGPELTGAGKHGARYFIENIIDPDAVVGKDFQLMTVETKDGDLIAGLAMGDTPSAMTLLHTGGPVVIPRADIRTSVLSEKSMMPEGLLDALNERQKIELLKFLGSN